MSAGMTGTLPPSARHPSLVDEWGRYQQLAGHTGSWRAKE